MTYGSEYEWRLAAQHCHYRYEDFVKLDGEKQSWHVAFYRVAMQSEAVLSQEMQKRANRLARQSKNKAPKS